eukprot:TRINITY_DN13440_c0_g1_i3.p1 TRINITY_DN13440_c0_g1~~TRINITY_DN13440_c0_g1_i3.p1  ORF type:complete len:304 (+),score=55.56 TRINITY_DN13440_c0_g1_i3:38-949(+)
MILSSDILFLTNRNLVSVFFFFFFQAEDGIRDAQESRGLGDVYKRQAYYSVSGVSFRSVFYNLDSECQVSATAAQGSADRLCSIVSQSPTQDESIYPFHGPIVLDTGTPVITVPSVIYDSLVRNSSQYLVVQLRDQDRKLQNLVLGTGDEMLQGGYLQVGWDDFPILGLPLWKYQYTVMDEDNRTVSFSRLSPVTAPASCTNCPAECTGGCWRINGECVCRINWDRAYHPVFCPQELSCEIVCNSCAGSIFHCPANHHCNITCLGESCEGAYFADDAAASRWSICTDGCTKCPTTGDLSLIHI